MDVEEVERRINKRIGGGIGEAMDEEIIDGETIVEEGRLRVEDIGKKR